MFTVWKEVVGWLTDTRSITYTWKFQLAYFYRALKALFLRVFPGPLEKEYKCGGQMRKLA